MEELRQNPIVLCIRNEDPDRALEGARAALDGGLRVIEVTLTTPNALAIIAKLSQDPRAIVGAGTLLSEEDPQKVVEAGGRFGLSPVCDPKVMESAKKAGLFFAPGTSTPSEIVRAHQLGAEVVKVFPIGPLGGPNFIRAVRGPLPHIPLLPTNGVSLENLSEYFEAGVFAVGVGREVLEPEALKARDYKQISERAAQFVAALPK